MVNDLKSNQAIEVLEDEVLTGYEDKTLMAYMDDLLYDLTFLKEFDFTDILDFYSQCGGCTISWTEKNKGNPHKGAIKILSFESVFLDIQQYFDTSLKSSIGTNFNGKHYKNKTFGELLFLFDVYSEQSGFALVFDSGNQPKLMMLSDYYIVWDHSRVTDFKSYFKFLLASRGSYGCRHKLFSYHQGDMLEPIFFEEIPYGTEAEPFLFKKD